VLGERILGSKRVAIEPGKHRKEKGQATSLDFNQDDFDSRLIGLADSVQ
jgi:hypothetical protein